MILIWVYKFFSEITFTEIYSDVKVFNRGSLKNGNFQKVYTF